MGKEEMETFRKSFSSEYIDKEFQYHKPKKAA